MGTLRDVSEQTVEWLQAFMREHPNSTWTQILEAYGCSFCGGNLVEREVYAALKQAEMALSTCYDVQYHPGDGTSSQDDALRSIRDALKVIKDAPSKNDNRVYLLEVLNDAAMDDAEKVCHVREHLLHHWTVDNA